MKQNQTNQKSSKLVDLLQQSKEQKDQKGIQSRVSRAKLQLQSNILATKESLEAKQEALEGVILTGNWVAVVQAQVEIEGLEDGLRRLEKLETELF